MEEPSIHDQLEIIPVTNAEKVATDDEDTLSSENGSKNDANESGDDNVLSGSMGKPSAAEIQRINDAKAREEQTATEKDVQEHEEQSDDVAKASKPKKPKKKKLMSHDWYKIASRESFWVVVRYL